MSMKKNVRDPFHKCDFCKENDICNIKCLNAFPPAPDKSKILKTAQEQRISVSDVITLIKL